MSEIRRYKVAVQQNQTSEANKLCRLPITAKARPKKNSTRKAGIKQHSLKTQEASQERNATSKPDLKRRESIDEEVLSPAKWRSPKTSVKPGFSNQSSLEKHEVLPRGDPFGVLYTLLEEDNEIIQLLAQLPHSVPKKFLSRRPVLPKNPNETRNTIVLDLDETLVHCTTELRCQVGKPDDTFSVTFHNVEYKVYMNKRPYLEHFLNVVSKWFEVIVFTASQKCYANTLLDKIDPEGKLIQYRAFRESCAYYMDNFMKPLHILNRDPKRVFLIDNSPQCFAFELDNGIPCTSWFDDKKDNELMRLLPYLRDMKDLDDVRPYIRKMFGTKKFLDSLQ